MTKDTEFYQLVHPGGPKGILGKKPRMKKNQDKRAKSGTMYAVAFFPKITGIGPARIHPYDIFTTLARTPDAAKVKFMDRLSGDVTWEDYSYAGWQIRKVKIIDLGDA